MNIEDLKCALLKKFPECQGNTEVHLLKYGKIVIFVEYEDTLLVYKIEKYLEKVRPLGVDITIGTPLTTYRF